MEPKITRTDLDDRTEIRIDLPNKTAYGIVASKGASEADIEAAIRQILAGFAPDDGPQAAHTVITDAQRYLDIKKRELVEQIAQQFNLTDAQKMLLDA